MDDIRIDATSAFTFDTRCQRAAALVPTEMKRAGDRCGALWERLAKSRARVRSGHLRRSPTFTTSVSLMSSTTLMGSNLPYAKAQDTGSPPHLILPKSGKVLAWKGSRVFGPVLRGVTSGRAGGTIFARVVHHPGTKGNRFLTGSFQELKPRFKAEFAKIGPAIAAVMRGAA